MSELDKLNEEHTMIIKTYWNAIGCASCPHLRFDEWGNKTGKCISTDIQEKIMELEFPTNP